MNAVAHRAFLKKYGNIFSDAREPIIRDGVSLYEELFFDPDPDKRRLIERIKEKYGDLPSGDRMHPPGAIARAIKRWFPKLNVNTTIISNNLYKKQKLLFVLKSLQ